MSASIEQLVTELTTAAADITAGYRGNKAAARRARAALQNIRNLAQETRKEILAVSKGEAPQQEVVANITQG